MKKEDIDKIIKAADSVEDIRGSVDIIHGFEWIYIEKLEKRIEKLESKLN